jgi:sulfide:quinone oxidoreductase|tara:strand:- start:5120 stop:6247 length:1128 start_codon:yes stop_codon:yes gene_type:complete
MHILVVGGGMGGTILANNLARRLSGELEQGSSKITMLSASDKHMYQPGLLYVAVGKMSTSELYRDQKSLLEPTIDFHVDPVEKFDLDNNSVTTKSGKKISYDIICIATGSRGNAAGIPGLAENACQFYTEADALAMYKKLQKFEGGKVVVATGVPHKCPMSPLEITFFLIDYFKKRGIWDKVDLHYTYPIGRVHSLEPVAKWAAPEFDKEGVTYETLFNMKEVVPGKVISEEDSSAEFDLLVTVPPHKGMQVIEDNELGKGGFIPTDKKKLNMEGRDNVFVLGDTTNLPISKAGSTAHFEAEALGENIAALVQQGEPVRDYDGKVFCFIEAGDGKATYAMFDYNNPPNPQAPTSGLHWFKTAYNRMYWASARGII